MAINVPIGADALRHFVGEIVAVDVSLDDYMDKYAAEYCEWIEGVVIRMSPVTGLHNEIVYFLRQLLQAYLELRPVGKVRSQPFVMRLPAFPKRRREPDIIVVLDINPHELRETFMDGPADIVIEVVSEESIERDYGEKFTEYEKGDVPEYWTIDPLRKESRFYRLDENGRYQRQIEDEHGNYSTPALPGLLVHVPTLWLPSFPGPGATFQAVSKMLEGK